MIQKTLINYFREGLWQQSPEIVRTPIAKHALRYLKIFTLASQGFIKNHGSYRASALTLYSLLSVVPVFAMLFGFAKGFGFEEKLEAYILTQMPEQNAMTVQFIEMAKHMLEVTKGGIVAGFGVALLFWSVLKVISNIEESFNHIWKVRKPRTPGRKLSDYLSLMLLAPFMLIIASSLSIYVQTQLADLMSAIAIPGTVAAIQLLAYLPILIYWGLFSFIFIFMPNTKVKVSSGIFAGVIAGTVYHILLFLYVSLQIGVSSYNAIYGSFSALPLFLIWLQVSWIIVLFGSELSFIHQNIAFYQFKQTFEKLNFNSRVMLSQHIMHTLIERFGQFDTKPYSIEEICLKLNMPIAIVSSILSELVECRLLSRIIDTDSDKVYFQPAYDASLLNDMAISDALKNNGEDYTIAPD